MDISAFAVAGGSDVPFPVPAHPRLSLRIAPELGEPSRQGLQCLPSFLGQLARRLGKVIESRLQVLLRRSTWLVAHRSTLSSGAGQEECRGPDSRTYPTISVV